jgi:hypothetical protein
VIYLRRCRACGFENGPWYEPPPPGCCARCDQGDVDVVETEGERPIDRGGDGPMSTGGFTPHFNQAFGQRVESAAHLRHLQRVHGTQDWRPLREREPVQTMLRKTGAIRRVPSPEIR